MMIEGNRIMNAVRWTARCVLGMACLAQSPLFGQNVDTSAPAVAPLAPVVATPKPAARTTRRLEEDELRLMLTDAISRQFGSNGTEVELRFSRPWAAITVPDGPLTICILEPSLDRLNTMFIVRFELRTGRETIGAWQAPLQMHLWHDVLVARSTLKRGQPLNEAELARERRDVLTLHDPLCELPADAATCELTENVPLGAPLTARSVRLRPVVFRGQTADAVVREGAMMISLKVEVLEEGVPGQMVRVRNLQSRRELHGKVEDEQTIAIPL
jgi:flagella basal body P-ring formation protein FlgA